MEIWTAFKESTSNASGSTHIQLGPLQMTRSDVSVVASDTNASAQTNQYDVSVGEITEEITVLDEGVVSGVANSSGDRRLLEYSVKIINPSKMSEFRNMRIGQEKEFGTMKEIRNFLSSLEVDEKPDFDVVEVGYIEPGHGMKGKKQWIHTNDDIKAMYEKHQGKSSVLFWAYSTILKSKATRSTVQHTDSAENSEKAKANVDEKYEELRKKHEGSQYTLEQLRMWAHMIQMGKHSSIEEPPDKPFWQGRRKRKSSSPQVSPNKRQSVSTNSPSKKVHLRSELLDQLAKWRKLKEDGVVSDIEYEELKETILSDIKTM